MKQFRRIAEKMKNTSYSAEKVVRPKTIFGQKSGPAMAVPAVPPTTALPWNSKKSEYISVQIQISLLKISMYVYEIEKIRLNQD